MNRLEWQWQRFPYSATESHGIFKTALTFVDHVSEIWGPLLNGLALVCVPREVTKNPEMLIPLLEKFEVDFITPARLLNNSATNLITRPICIPLRPDRTPGARAHAAARHHVVPELPG